MEIKEANIFALLITSYVARCDHNFLASRSTGDATGEMERLISGEKRSSQVSQQFRNSEESYRIPEKWDLNKVMETLETGDIS